MTTVPDNHYLSIGEVLGLLLEDFPDVTISKIRFLESQGLIEPERTPSGYRKFYEHDVDLLRAILHEQKDNFLPLKVIRDRIESGAIEADPTGGRTPPRGIRNVQVRETGAVEASPRDSVFRRTDGGPEWADGRALIPGEVPTQTNHHPSAGGSTGAVPVTPLAPAVPAPTPDPGPVVSHTPAPKPVKPAAAHTPPPAAAPAPTPTAPAAAPPTVPPTAPPTVPTPPTLSVVGSLIEKPSPARPIKRTPADAASMLPYNRDELLTASGITEAQLSELDEFGIVPSRGSGADATYQADAVEIARVAGKFLAQGIDARHLRPWRQGAEREAALFEQRIMPLLRQRNPQSRQQALDTLSELADLGGQLRAAMVDSMLRHHFDGS
ncbi:unannotated protein [freshwater metagenome]|uniref:Unannotated protein n=1 Tax=freshwater metagenome TaxID=449393 RepID=A0A6J7E8W7_9ZZZZ